MCSLSKTIVLNIVGLTPTHLANKEITPHISRIADMGAAAKVRPQFPAVTGSVQATYLTGEEPSFHGIVGNGMFDRLRNTVTMWEQTGARLEAEPIWQTLKGYDPKARTAILFWQFIKFAAADIIITPSPIHHSQGMTMWCFSKPNRWYEEIVSTIGPFPLHNFWGPFSSVKSSEWILKATLETLNKHQPELTLAYLPNLDYNAQRFGPDSPEALQSVKEMDDLIGHFFHEVEAMGEEVTLVLLSEYAIKKVERAVHINRVLREHGYLKVVQAAGKEYIDYYHSRAFAVSDHQIAHIYCQADAVSYVKRLLCETPGIDYILGDLDKQKFRIHHPNSGDLVAVADKDAWFTYYWWTDPACAPEFAKTVDIHNKPGYDPAELFFDPETRSIPLKPELVRGSHGRPPESDDDLVSLIAYGPKARVIGDKAVWAARDVRSLILELMGCS